MDSQGIPEVAAWGPSTPQCMTQIADEYKSAQIAFAEALAYEFGMNPDDVCAVLDRDPVGLALDDLHAAWLQFSDEQDFGAEVATDTLLMEMADEAAITDAHELDDEDRRAAEEEAAWNEHCDAFPGDDDDGDDIAARDEPCEEEADEEWHPGDDL